MSFKEKLYKPFDNIDNRKGRGGYYDYIKWKHVVDRMNEVFDGRWSSKVISETVTEKEVIVRVSVKIIDPTDGSEFIQEGYGGSVFRDGDESGTAHKGAYSKAIKDACKKWGVGLYLEGSSSNAPAQTTSNFQGPSSVYNVAPIPQQEAVHKDTKANQYVNPTAPGMTQNFPAPATVPNAPPAPPIPMASPVQPVAPAQTTQQQQPAPSQDAIKMPFDQGKAPSPVAGGIPSPVQGVGIQQPIPTAVPQPAAPVAPVTPTPAPVAPVAPTTQASPVAPVEAVTENASPAEAIVEEATPESPGTLNAVQKMAITHMSKTHGVESEQDILSKIINVPEAGLSRNVSSLEDLSYVEAVAVIKHLKMLNSN